MNSAWETTKQRSRYHFRTDTIVPHWDCVQQLGHIEPCWQSELVQAIEQAYPVTWRTRGRPGETRARSSEEHDQEEYDLDRYGIPRDYVVSNMTYSVAPVFEKIADQFGLEETMTRIHVQLPGQVWNLHLDKLEKWMPEDPSRVARYFVQLTDWQQGHFWNYGNYMWSHWRAGDVSTFDWQNVPHSTANAGHVPRATLQITGIRTDQTQKYLQTLAHKSSV